MGSIWLFNSPWVYMCLVDVFFGLAWVRGRIVMNPSAVWPIWQFQTVFFCWLDLLCFVFLLLPWANLMISPRLATKIRTVTPDFSRPKCRFNGVKMCGKWLMTKQFVLQGFQYQPKMVKLVNGFWCLALLHQLQAKETRHMLLLVPRYLNWHMIYD